MDEEYVFVQESPPPRGGRGGHSPMWAAAFKQCQSMPGQWFRLPEVFEKTPSGRHGLSVQTRKQQDGTYRAWVMLPKP